ncbi:MAG: hypothetical protein QME66_05975 [Candidatus Eisenbacteria bacterium]|nr:hypothetical protein [Candidatus Eisenbacteria bacterium]
MREILAGLFVSLVGLVGLFQEPVLADWGGGLYMSSATVSGVIITTGTAIRVDNRYRNLVSSASINIGVVPNRYMVSVQNQDGTDSIYCGFDSLVSTTTTLAADRDSIGWQIYGDCNAGDIRCEGFFPLSANAALWCRAVNAAGANGVLTAVAQYGK